MDTDQEKKIQILKKMPFLKEFSDEETAFLIGITKWLKLDKGDILFREGSSERTFFIIIKGSVSVQKKTGMGALKKTLTTLNAGQCFGEMSFVLGTPRSADIVADEDTYILRIDSDTLNRDEANPVFKSVQYKIYKAFSEILAGRLIDADRELARIF